MSLAEFGMEHCGYCHVFEKAFPEGAVSMSDDRAVVLWEHCTARASQGMGLSVLKELLDSGRPVIALVDPKFPRYLDPRLTGFLPELLKSAGFAKVLRLDVFVSAVAGEYLRYLHSAPPGPILTSDCPTVVRLVERRFPELISHLAPVVSPMTAAARFARLAIPECSVVYFGPCVGKKREVARLGAETADLALTFGEMRDFLDELVIPGTAPEESSFDSELVPPDCCSHHGNRSEKIRMLTVCGSDLVLQVLQGLGRQSLSPYLVEMAFCGQCGVSLEIGRRLNLAVTDIAGSEASSTVEPNLARQFQDQPVCTSQDRAPDDCEYDLLTPQETRVLALLGEGLDNRAISTRLFISENTVKIHLKNIYRKLNVKSRVQAVLVTANWGLLKRD